MKKKLFLTFAVFAAAIGVNAQKRMVKNHTNSQRVDGIYSQPEHAFVSPKTSNGEVKFDLSKKRGVVNITDTMSIANAKWAISGAQGKTYKIRLINNSSTQFIVLGAKQKFPFVGSSTLKGFGMYAKGLNPSGKTKIDVAILDGTGYLGSEQVEITNAAGYEKKFYQFSNSYVLKDTFTLIISSTDLADSLRIVTSGNVSNLGVNSFNGLLNEMTLNPSAQYSVTGNNDYALAANTAGTAGADSDWQIYPIVDYSFENRTTANNICLVTDKTATFSFSGNEALLKNPHININSFFIKYAGQNKTQKRFLASALYNGVETDTLDNLTGSFSFVKTFADDNQKNVTISEVLKLWGYSKSYTFTSSTDLSIGKQNGVSITGANAVCVGSKTQLTASVAGGTWGRLSGSSFSLISTTGEVTGAAAGQTVIRYTITGAGVGCPSVATKAITVNALPATAGTVTGSAWVCKTGGATKLTPSVAGGTWASLKPSIATVDNQGNVTGLVKTSSLVTGVLSYTVSNPAGCSRTILRSVGVDSTPVAPTIVGPAGTGAASICSNGTLLFRSTIPTATWSAGPYLTAGTTYPGLFQHRVATNGAVPSDNYETFVKATSYSFNRVCTNFSTKVVKLRTATSKSFAPSAITAPASIVVNVSSNVSVVLPATLTLANTTNRAWNSSATADMSVVTSTTLSTTVKALKVPTVSPKLYFTAVETSTGCGMTAFKALTVTATQSIVDANNDVNSTIGVNVYPNPSNGVVTFENIAGANAISLVDMTGRTVKTVAVNADRMTVDFSGVQNGKYLVQVAGENVNEVRSIVIE